MTVVDDLGAEQDRLGDILAALDDEQWQAPSLATGWTVRDVVVHLAQTEELALARLAGTPSPTQARPQGSSVGELMARLVAADPATPQEALRRWQEARRPALEALRAADPHRGIEWAAAPLRPGALATTRLAETWTHGLDVTTPLGLSFPDTERLRHIAWLAHRMLPYAFGLANEPAPEVRVLLTAPDGRTTWEFGPPQAASAITGDAGVFCRVAAQRLDPAKAGPAKAGLTTSGPDGARALTLIRTYAA